MRGHQNVFAYYYSAVCSHSIDTLFAKIRDGQFPIFSGKVEKSAEFLRVNNDKN